MLARKVNREDHDLKKQSGLGLHCLFRMFLQAANVRSFCTSMVCKL